MMKVIRSGSALRLRISFAARPTATRSRDSSSASASSSESRSPSRALSMISVTITSRLRTRARHRYVVGHAAPREGVAALCDTRARVSYPCLAPVRGSCDHGLSDEPQFRHLVELAGFVRELEERH